MLRSSRPTLQVPNHRACRHRCNPAPLDGLVVLRDQGMAVDRVHLPIRRDAFLLREGAVDHLPPLGRDPPPPPRRAPAASAPAHRRQAWGLHTKTRPLVEKLQQAAANELRARSCLCAPMGRALSLSLIVAWRRGHYFNPAPLAALTPRSHLERLTPATRLGAASGAPATRKLQTAQTRDGRAMQAGCNPMRARFHMEIATRNEVVHGFLADGMAGFARAAFQQQTCNATSLSFPVYLGGQHLAAHTHTDKQTNQIMRLRWVELH